MSGTKNEPESAKTEDLAYLAELRKILGLSPRQVVAELKKSPPPDRVVDPVEAEKVPLAAQEKLQEDTAYRKATIFRQEAEAQPARDLVSLREKFLPQGSAAVATLRSQLAALDKLRDDERYAEDEFDLGNFNAASDKVELALAQLESSSKSLEAECVKETERRRGEVERLKGRLNVLEPKKNAAILPLVRLADGDVHKGKLDDLCNAARQLISSPAVSSPESSHAAFQAGAEQADEKLTDLEEAINTAKEASAEEFRQRGEWLKERQEAFDRSYNKLTELASSRSNLIEGWQSREAEQRKVLFEQRREAVRSCSAKNQEAQRKSLNEVIAQQEQQTAAAEKKVKDYDDGASARKKLPTVNDRLAKEKVEFPKYLAKSGFIKQAQQTFDLVQPSLNMGEGQVALARLNEVDGLLNQSEALRDQCRRINANYPSLEKRTNHIPGTKKVLVAQHKGLIEASLADIGKLTDQATDLEKLMGSTERVIKSLDKVMDNFLGAKRRSKDGGLALDKARKAVSDIQDPDLQLLKVFESVEALERVIQDTDKDYSKLIAAEKDVTGVGGEAQTKLKSWLKALREDGSKHKNGFEGVAVGLDQATLAVADGRKLAQACQKIRKDVQGVSSFQNFAAPLSGIVEPLLKSAEGKFAEAWLLTAADEDLSTATGLVEQWTKLGDKLEESKSAVTAGLRVRQAGPQSCLTGLVAQLIELAKASNWGAGLQAASEFKVVAEAINTYESARGDIQKKLQTTLKTTSPKGLQAVRSSAQKLFDDTARPAEDNRAANADVYGASREGLLRLGDVYDAMDSYAPQYQQRAASLQAVLGLYPKEDQDGPKKDKELVESLAKLAAPANDNQAAEAAPYNTAANNLKQIDALLTKIQEERRQAVQKHLETTYKGKPQEKAIKNIYESQDGQNAMAGLFQSMGTEGMAEFLTDLDVIPGDNDKKLVASSVVNLHKSVGSEGITMLQTNLGSTKHMAALMDGDGSAAMLTGLHTQFESDPDSLQDLVTQGMGGDTRALASIGRDLCKGDATKLKKLSDSFGNRSQLKELVDIYGAESCGTQLDKVATNRYGGDVSQLKTRLYDTVDRFAANTGNAPAMRKKMFKAIPTFESAAPPNNPARANVPLVRNPDGLKASTLKSRKHFLERHTRACYDLSEPPKEENTQWPVGTTDADVANYLEAAIEEANNCDIFSDDGAYTKKVIPLKALGIWVKIGYYNNTKEITQFFPIPAARMSAEDAGMDEQTFQQALVGWPNPPPVVLEDFPEDVMKTIVNAIR